jgi:hypothetical protein
MSQQILGTLRKFFKKYVSPNKSLATKLITILMTKLDKHDEKILYFKNP